ncbi:MAG: type II toxin-antitoxin system RelE/ParE family toxin [Methylovulum sp.]|uniref:type II toxin-antitoxin system RelE/ParE family toxin n=1 Tax=Methylovulum sp. TaxID=1916980 RepID=UPI00261DA981|nr:type II toxin-antitoxin system RelE/ParE family toxin [Methylovulum sp.]MDD2724338.1 type II toxin-antitoxin system RelE/ParE family toxin [Methylovulum sp.]MDD5124934.1 type II toxin-antitoxin system RelE/ParE family toxin [Methylovulum sp.]
MSQVILTEKASSDIFRLYLFLLAKNEPSAKRAVQTIKSAFNLLAQHPELGRPVENEPELKELLIDFGNSGYTALYHFEQNTDQVIILAIRHQREAGY